METMEFKATIIGDPVRDLTLCLLGGKQMQPKDIILPGLQPVFGYNSGISFDVYVDGREHHINCHQVADDFNPFNPFQFAKVIGTRQSYREFTQRVYRDGLIIQAIIIQDKSYQRGKFPEVLFIGSTDPNNKVNDWHFPWINLTVPQKAYNNSQCRAEFNIKATPDIVMTIDVPAGSYFSVTFLLKKS